MTGWLPWLTDALVILGVAVMTVGVYGVFRMPDVYTELHAASKAVFLGVIVLVAASVGTLDGAIVARGALIALFLVATTPVAAHTIALAAYRSGEPLETPGARDESRGRVVTAHADAEAASAEASATRGSLRCAGPAADPAPRSGAAPDRP